MVFSFLSQPYFPVINAPSLCCASVKVKSVARFRTQFSSFFNTRIICSTTKTGIKKDKNIESFLFAQNCAVFFCMCVAYLVLILFGLFIKFINQSIALACVCLFLKGQSTPLSIDLVSEKELSRISFI